MEASKAPEAAPQDRRSRLEIESLDLGADVRAVGFELIESDTREPVRGLEAAGIWSVILPALAAAEPWALDFFAHIERVREFCNHGQISFRQPNAHVLVVPAPPAEQLQNLLNRFAPETFGVRAGGPLVSGDATLEAGLAKNGVDAYHTPFVNYEFCGVCDFDNGFFTLLSERLWATEVIRRTRAALTGLQVDVVRPG